MTSTLPAALQAAYHPVKTNLSSPGKACISANESGPKKVGYPEKAVDFHRKRDGRRAWVAERVCGSQCRLAGVDDDDDDHVRSEDHQGPPGTMYGTLGTM